MLEYVWIGTSDFWKINHEGDNKVSSMWADWASQEEFDADASIKKVAWVKEKGKADTKASTRRPFWSLTALAARAYPPGAALLSSWAGPYQRGGSRGIANSSRVILEADCVHEYPISPCLINIDSHSLVCPEPNLSPAICTHVFSSETQGIVGEGECQAGIGRSGETESEVDTLSCNILIDETLWGARMRADLKQSRKTNMSADMYLKTEQQAEISVAPLLALSGLAALGLFVI